MDYLENLIGRDNQWLRFVTMIMLSASNLNPKVELTTAICNENLLIMLLRALREHRIFIYNYKLKYGWQLSPRIKWN